MIEILHTPLWLAVLIGGSIFAGTAYAGLRLGARSRSPRFSPWFLRRFQHDDNAGVRTASSQSNKRFLRRFSVDDKARIYLFENGRRHLLHGRICDISDDGAQMISPIPLNTAQTLYIELPKLQLAGTARVLTCAQKKRSYHIGLQFTGPLFHWFGSDTPDAISYTAIRTDS